MRSNFFRSGFTLVELLVAISILAIVAVLGWRGLDSIARSRVALTSELEQTRGLQLTFAQMQSDCAQNVNPLSYPNLPEGRTVWIEPQRFILVRNVFQDDVAPAMQIVTWRLQDARLTRFESIPTRDLAMLAQLLEQARNPPDKQIGITMQNNLQSIEFAGYPDSSLAGSAVTPNPANPPNLPNSSNPNQGGATAPGGNPNSGNPSGVTNLPNVNLAKLTTGLQVTLQLKNHENTMQKIFILGGT